MHKYTLKEFEEQFPNDDACLHHIFQLTHGDNKPCVKCASIATYSRIKDRKGYQCSKCSHQIHPMKGTIYEKSRTPLLYWFEAMFLFIKSKNGLSAKELQRILGVTYKTAYRMLMHIRASMKQQDHNLCGVLEMDETFVGGKNINRHYDKKVPNSQGRSCKDKTPIFGMFERETGEVRTIVTSDTARKTIQPLIFEYVDIDSHIMSDEWKAYNGLGRYYIHTRVNHKAKNYADGGTTTNRIENFWSVLKRTIKGSYIHISRKHLQKYTDEVTFRFNNRNNPLIFHDLLTYSFLTRTSQVC